MRRRMTAASLILAVSFLLLPVSARSETPKEVQKSDKPAVASPAQPSATEQTTPIEQPQTQNQEQPPAPSAESSAEVSTIAPPLGESAVQPPQGEVRSSAVMESPSNAPEQTTAGSTLVTPGNLSSLDAGVKTVAIPANTVVNVRLGKPLISKDNKLGDEVTATVQEALYIGPFLTIPTGATLSGKVTDVLKESKKGGPNPYVIVDFYEMKRPNEEAVLPFKGTIIAYKTGLQKHDYVWKMPSKKSRLRDNLTGALGGAMTGLMINPIFGAPIGAGAGFLKSVLVNKVAQKGAVKISEKEEVPVAIQQSFDLPVISQYSNNSEQQATATPDEKNKDDL